MTKPAAHSAVDGAAALLDQLEDLLKEPRSALSFAQRRVNTSLAQVAVQGLRAYLEGDHEQAAEDLLTVGHEIEARFHRR